MSQPLLCDVCHGELESDDAISIIEGVCSPCRHRVAKQAPGASLSPPAVPADGRNRGGAPARRPVGPEIARVPSGVHLQRPRADAPPSLISADGRMAIRTARERRRRRDLIIGGTMGLVVTACAAVYLLSGEKQEPGGLSSSQAGRPVSMSLTVKPPGARVTLDGVSLSPPDEFGRLQLHLPADGPAVRWLEVSARGFRPLRRALSSASGVTDLAIELIPQPYELTVRTTPPDAEVWINDEFKGHSPTTLSLLPRPGARLTVKRAGYSEVVRELQPSEDGKPVLLDFPLRVAELSLRVESQPPGALVAVEGVVRGKSPVDVRLDATTVGRALTVTASLPGYVEAAERITIPSGAPGRTEPLVARLGLRPLGSAGGTELGGVVSASPPAPSAAEPRRSAERAANPTRSVSTVDAGPTKNRRERVALLFLSPTGVGADHYALIQNMSERISRLEAEDQFAIFTCTVDGIEAWPGSNEVLPATPPQRIRAYDRVRLLRPSGRGHIAAAMEAALATRPTSVWVFTAGPLDHEDLKPLDRLTDGAQPAMHVVLLYANEKERWWKEWTTRHGGSLTILGMDRVPALARWEEAEP